ncbi:MAG TPA: xanthine dehydrogenase family protein subunit M [Candidatus Limnocylindrales bacterium]|nr:xanthine dehydrogenase family protein subunit M [Candidatus Limnocylindrales bacterium]
MIPAAFDYERAASLDDAVAKLAANPGAKLLAGGHSLLPLMKLRLAAPERLIDIGRLSELKGIEYLPDGGVEVGSLTTYAELLGASRLEWVTEAVRDIGDVQVRNRGTIGGGISHADPASDMPAIGIALGYSAVLRSARGEREVPLDDFFRGPFHTAMEPDEILVRLRRPPLPAGAGGAYANLEQPASGYSLVGIAAVVARSGGTISHARIGVTGVHEHAYRATEVEDALIGSDGSAAAIARAAALITTGAEVQSDIHADGEYRSAMAVVYARRAIETALSRAA